MDAVHASLASILDQLTNLSKKLDEEAALRRETQEKLEVETAERQSTQNQLNNLMQQLNAGSSQPQTPPTPHQPDPAQTQPTTTTTPPSQQIPTPETLSVADVKALVNHSRGPKVGTPDKFDGTKGDKAEAFVNQVGLYILANPMSFPNDNTKIVFTLSYLTGEANQWAAPFYRKLLHDADGDELTWKSFGHAFEATYFDSDRQNRAQRDLRSLQQTGSVADYTTKFMALSARTGWGESEHISHYRIGLKQEIRVNMIMKTFDSLPSISAYALAVDNEIHPGANRTISRTVTTPISTPKDPDAMDLSSTRVDFSRAGVSREEMSRRAEKGLCFKCGKGRHRASDCGKKDSKGNWVRSGGGSYSRIAELELQLAELQTGGEGRADDSKNGAARD